MQGLAPLRSECRWTSAATRPAGLSALSEEERYHRFDTLQARMPAVWEAMRLNLDDESVVVVPSITLDRATAASGSLTQAFEERFLFLLVLLRQPRLRMIYVTSMPIAPEIVEYYLALLSGVIPSHARSRLALVAVHDSSPRSLSEKLLERPRLLARIADLIPNRSRSHLVPYNTTELERDVAISLGIPMYGADPRLAPLGTKSGCRRLFAESGVPHPLGVEDVRTVDDLADAVATMRASRPQMKSVIVKLNEGVSGAGNSLVRLEGLPRYRAQHGGPVADQLVRVAARTLVRHRRGMHIAAAHAREGMFLAVLSGSDLQGAGVYAARLRADLMQPKALPPFDGVSIGIAAFDVSMESPGDLIRRAMYALEKGAEAGGKVMVVGQQQA